MPKFRNLSTAKIDGAPTKAELVERIARHLQDLLLLDYPNVVAGNEMDPSLRCRYLAVAERMLDNPPPGFKRV